VLCQRFDTEAHGWVQGEMQAVCIKVVTSSSVASSKLFGRAKYYRGFPESRPVFSPPMGAYFTWAFIWC